MNRMTREATLLEDEPATLFLQADCYGDATDWQVKMVRTKAYRKEHGILFAHQLEVIAKIEFTVETVDLSPRGIFWRSHPEGRKLSEAYGRGAGYYA